MSSDAWTATHGWLVVNHIYSLLPATLSNPCLLLLRQINSIQNKGLKMANKVQIMSNAFENGTPSRSCLFSIKPGTAALAVLDHCD